MKCQDSQNIITRTEKAQAIISDIYLTFGWFKKDGH